MRRNHAHLARDFEFLTDLVSGLHRRQSESLPMMMPTSGAIFLHAFVPK